MWHKRCAQTPRRTPARGAAAARPLLWRLLTHVVGKTELDPHAKPHVIAVVEKVLASSSLRFLLAEDALERAEDGRAEAGRAAGRRYLRSADAPEPARWMLSSGSGRCMERAV